MESIKKNKILLSIFAIVFVVFIYSFFFSGGSSNSPEVINNLPGSPNSLMGNIPSGQGSVNTGLLNNNKDQDDLVSILNKINTVVIDTSLFDKDAWTNLKDFSESIPNNTPGKNDLFAPVGQSNFYQAVTATSKI